MSGALILFSIIRGVYMKKRRSFYVRIVSILSALVFCLACIARAFSAPLVGVCAGETSSHDISQYVVDFVNQLNAGATENLEALGEDLANGNLNATTALAKKRAKYAALQLAFMARPELQWAYYAGTAFLNGVDNAWDDVPESSVISGGGVGAFYKSHVDDNIHFVNYSAFSAEGASFNYPWISSDEFTVYVNYTNRYGSSAKFVSAQTSDGVGAVLSPYVSGGRVTFSSTGGYFTSGDLQVASGYDNTSRLLIKPNSSGAISDITTNFYSLSVSNPQNCGHYGDIAELPPETVDPRYIYNYYNNVIIPYIQQDSGDSNIDVYLFIPRFEIPDPPEPPTLPNGGIQIGGNYDIDINIYYP